MEKRDLEDRIRQLSVEKEEAIRAVRVETTFASQPRSSPDNEVDHPGELSIPMGRTVMMSFYYFRILTPNLGYMLACKQVL